ncbi:hypothetical protein BDQ12DRAFT_710172 [Crucibulum laeve]|uniref:Enoyl reductase (ER) domain-containing protein n=1 Tax=Crucibulum laeve TaxID=68775 RepID=A0A5C3MC17_9AGAR|nr:hypothetical protein BDQ12DRAFT_710172 [Crucibulum laeve]
MSAIPDVQNAWIVTRAGVPSKALQFKADWPVPKKLAKGEVLVKVHAAALNPVGYKIMQWMPGFMQKIPRIAEHDLAGEIVDANGTGFTNGDQVFGWISAELNGKTGQGALAQYVRMPADHLVVRPPNISPVEASGVTLTGQTAYLALDMAKLEAGQTIFVNGGSTAVGTYAIQLAKAAGAKVVATASEKNEEFLRTLGVDEFIDYTKVNLAEYLTKNPPSPKYHVILDAVGLINPSLYTSSEAYLAPNGVFMSTGPLPQKGWIAEFGDFIRTVTAILRPKFLGGTKRRYSVVLLGGNIRAALETLQKYLADGSVKPMVDSVFAFEDALKAYERIKTHRATGKVVVKVDPAIN